MSCVSVSATCMLLIILFMIVPAEAKRDPQLKWLSKKPLISSVEVIGNSYFGDNEIKRSIRSKENGFWQSVRLSKRHRLKKDSRKVDLAAVRYLYRSNGFLDAVIDEEFIVAEDSSAIVRIIIEEGRQRIVRLSTSPSNLGVFNDKISHHLRQLKPGDPLNLYRVRRIAFDMKTVHANAGYPYAEVKDSVVLYEDHDSADVIFTIDRGPVTLFGDIYVDSLEFTRESTFLRELSFEPGDLYSRQKIIDSRQRVYGTGLANYVDLSLKDPPEEDSTAVHDVRPNFRLKVKERKPKFLRIKTGAGQYEHQDLVWDLGLEFGSRNISGKGRRVKFELLSSFLIFAENWSAEGWRVIRERFAFEYMEPWMFKIRMPLTFMFAVEPGIRSQTRNYRISTIELGVRTSRQLSRHTKADLDAVYEKVNITDIPADSVEVKLEEEGISINRMLVFRLERDTRNNILLPVKGSFYQLRTEYVGGFLGGDNSFVKLTTNISRYQNFYGTNVYAWNYRIGWAVGTGHDPYVPSTDRYYFGGGKSLRGYVSNDVGPRTPEGDRAGGRVLLQTNQEIRRPLFWKFWGSVFVDVGSIYEDFKYFKWKTLLVSGGLGIQYISPVGPVRLDYGRRLVRGDYPSGGRFHFSILYAF